MGKYNSSIYRVRPLMKFIETDYDAFLTFLSLVGITPLGVPEIYRYDGEKCAEMQLKPTKPHLLALINLMSQKNHSIVNVKGGNRSDLFFGCPEKREAARIKAINELESKYDSLSASDKMWYVFVIAPR